MGRSLWKLVFLPEIFFKKGFVNQSFYKTRLRSHIILLPYLNKKFLVYNGIWDKSFVIKKGMIGKKLGEFSFTKKTGLNLKKKKRR